MKGGFDYRKAAKVLADALTIGHEEAAKRHKVSTKTVGRYVKRLESGDDKLSELVLKEGQKAEAVVGHKRRSAIQVVEAKMIALCNEATVMNLGAVVEAYKALRDTELTAKVLNVGVGPDPEGAEPAEDAGEPGEGESLGGGTH